MSHRTTAATTVAGVAAVAVLAATVPPAQAATTTIVDGDDSTIRADVLKVDIGHRADRIKVKIYFDDLLRDGRHRSQGVSIFFDTDQTDRGPEYRLGGGLNSGTDYALHEVEGWADDGEPLQFCDYDGRVKWRKDTVRYLVDPACFGDVDEVRVAVKAGEWTRATGNRSDWMLGRRTFSEPVARG